MFDPKGGFVCLLWSLSFVFIFFWSFLAQRYWPANWGGKRDSVQSGIIWTKVHCNPGSEMFCLLGKPDLRHKSIYTNAKRLRRCQQSRLSSLELKLSVCRNMFVYHVLWLTGVNTATYCTPVHATAHTLHSKSNYTARDAVINLTEFFASFSSDD